MTDGDELGEQPEEENLSLTTEEADDLAFPAIKPPEVTYSGQDFDVEGLVRRLDRGDIVVPSFGDTADDIETAGFQRGFVWSRPQMDRFIESLLLGFPIPGIFLVRQGDNRMLVLDGQQRLRTLQAFYGGIHSDRTYKLQYVAPQFKDLTYTGLHSTLRRNLDNSFIQATIVSAQPDANNMEAIYQIFERLNSGGTQLTAHEIRVALYAGPIINYLEQLNRNQDWRKLYGKKSARIRDQELIARILALYLFHQNYSRPLKTFINSFIERNRPDICPETKRAGDLFAEAARLLQEHVGQEALRRASRQVNTAWTDALFFGLMCRLEGGKSISGDDLLTAYDSLRSNQELQGLMVGSTADETTVERRLAITRSIFSQPAIEDE